MANKVEDVKLSRGPVNVLVEADEEHEDWIEYIFDSTVKTLETYDSALDLDFKTASEPYFLDNRDEPSVRIIGKEKVLLDGKWIGAYNNTSGVFGPDMGIFLEYGLTPVGNPAVIIHELGHYWFYWIPWLNEGIVSYLPVFLAERGLLDLTGKEVDSIKNHWGHGSFPDKFPDHGRPTIDDFRFQVEGGIHLWYAKTFYIQHLLRSELGDDYLDFIKGVLEFGYTEDTEDILVLLKGTKQIDWKEFLTGLVFAE